MKPQAALILSLFLLTSSPMAAMATDGLALPIGLAETSAHIVASDDGVIAVWVDYRNNPIPDLRALRYNADGTVDSAWPQAGLVIERPWLGVGFFVTSDNSGGTLVSFQIDNQLFVRHITRQGQSDPSWPGRSVVSMTTFSPTAYVGLHATFSDGSGGLIAAASVGGDAVVFHVLASRTLDPAWPSHGSIIAGATNMGTPTYAQVDSGGLLIAYSQYDGGVYLAKLTANGLRPSGWPTSPALIAATYPNRVSGISLAQSTDGATLVGYDSYPNGNPSHDVRLQRVIGNGKPDPNWPTDGITLALSSGGIASPIAPDGQGGAFISWHDGSYSSNAHTQRIQSNGAISAGWPTAGYPFGGTMITDGSGGAIAVNNTYFGAVINHFISSGLNPSFHNNADLLVDFISNTTSSGNIKPTSTILSNGNLIIAWQTTDPHVHSYLQQIDRTGILRFPRSDYPSISSVRDVPGDQGGKVKVSWTMSSDEGNGTGTYRVWRSVPPNLAASKFAVIDATPLEKTTTPAPGRVYASTNPALANYYWELYNSMPGALLEGYSMVCETGGDSTAAGNPRTFFMIQHISSSSAYPLESAPDSGYSVDNLSPPTPMPFVGQFSAAANRLHWTPSRAADFKSFELHRGLTRDFVPDASNLLYTGSDTGYVDAPGAYHYKLVALDVHGNASKPTLVSHNAPTAALASLVAAEALDDRVKVSWYLAGDPTASVTVQRRESFGAWQTVATVTADGTGLVAYEDTDVTPGGRYTYRLGVLDEGTVVYAGETPELEVGAIALTARLLGVSPNPAPSNHVVVRLALPGSSRAKLEMFDAQGRMVRQHTFEIGKSGTREVEHDDKI